MEVMEMTTIEVSAIYKADRVGFHMDDAANAIFEAHGGEWVDQGTIYGCGEMHLDRNLTYNIPVEQVGAAKAALEQAGFRVTINTVTMDDLRRKLDVWRPGYDEDLDEIESILSTILVKRRASTMTSI
jgi:hypothetical protein